MKRFIEVTVVLREKASIGHTTLKYKRLIDLNSVSTIYEDLENIIKFDDGICISVSAESYNAVRDALLKGDLHENGDTINRIKGLEGRCDGGNSIADKLCELQYDNTWIRQAMNNLFTMLVNVNFTPAIMLGCHDEGLDSLFENSYERVRAMQERIKELEEENKKLKGE